METKSFRVAEKGWPEGDTGVGKGGTGGGKGDEFRTLSIYWELQDKTQVSRHTNFLKGNLTITKPQWPHWERVP